MNEFGIDFGQYSDDEWNETHQSSYGHVLKEKLQIKAEERTSREISSIVRKVSEYSPDIPPKETDGWMRDSVLTLRTLFELQASELLSVINTVRKGEKELIKWNGVDIKVDHYGQSSYGLEFPKGLDFSTTRQATISSLQHSSIARSFINAAKIFENKQLTSTLNNNFCIKDDPLKSAAFLSLIGIRMFGEPVYENETHDLDELAEKVLTETLLHKANYDENNRIKNVSFRVTDSVFIQLEPVIDRPDKDSIITAQWAFKIDANPSEYLLESGNQSSVTTDHFIFRPTGKALVDSLDTCGLKFSHNFERFILRDNGSSEDRYGGSFTEISRVLAKIIQNGDIARINEIFTTNNGDTVSKDQIVKLSTLESDDNGFKALQKILKQLLARKPEDLTKGLPASDKDIHIREGACFDVTGYYLQSEANGKLKTIMIGNHKFLYKTHGIHTLINSEEVNFKGIRLPKGSLFVQDSNGRLSFLRLTPFMFDSKEDMISAFGTELLKAELTDGSIDRVMALMKS